MSKKIRITETQLKRILMEQYPYQDYEETAPQHEPDLYDNELGPGPDMDFNDKENESEDLKALINNLGTGEDPFTLEEIIEMVKKYYPLPFHPADDKPEIFNQNL